jgi:uncharacterized protein (DUF983 family)
MTEIRLSCPKCGWLRGPFMKEDRSISRICEDCGMKLVEEEL